MLRVLTFLLGFSITIYSLCFFFSPGFYASIDGMPIEVSGPINLSPGTHIIEFQLSELPESFSFKVDDCLESLVINDVPVTTSILPYCDWANSKEIPLHVISQLPFNKVVAKVTNAGGAGSFEAFYKQNQRLRLVQSLLLTSGVLLLLFAVSSPGLAYCLPLLIGCIVRATTASVISIEQRSNDFEGHLDYLKFVLKNWSIPSISTCWECYQPPTFYFSSALFFKAFQYVASDMGALTLFPLIISILSAYLAVLLYKLWVPNPKQAYFLIPFLIIPGTVFTEISYNNDSLLALMSLLVLYQGSSWYLHGQKKLIYPTSIAVAVGFLTKLSILPMAIWCFIILLCKNMEKKELGKVLIKSALCILIIVGPYFVYRLKSETKLEPLSNTEKMTSRLIVTTNILDFLHFDPLTLVSFPFVEPFSHDTKVTLHRENFLEYAFLSGIFLERQFQRQTLASISVGLLLFSLIITSLALLWNFRSISLKIVPVLVASILLVLSLALNRYLYPFSCSANYRYIPGIAVLLGIVAANSLKLSQMRGLIFFSMLFGVTLAWYVILS